MLLSLPNCEKQMVLSGVVNMQKKHVFLNMWYPHMQLLKPRAFTRRIEVQVCMRECILIKGLKQSLSPSLSNVGV